MTDKEINTAFEEKVKRGIFKPVHRRLSNAPTVEDRMQDALALTWAMFKRYAQRGRVLDDAILVLKCRYCACDLARQFVPADGSWRNQDVMDVRAFRDGRVQVLRIDGVVDDQNVEGDRALQVGLAEEMAASPERKMNSALDLESWIGELTFRDRAIMQRKMEGYETTRVAHELGLPYMATYRREKQLGKELASRAGVRVQTGRRRRGTPRSHALAISQTAAGA
jgi:hypothetical protein